MNKWLIYLCGVLTGIVLTIVVAFVLYSMKGNTNSPGSAIETEAEANNPEGVTMFEEPGDIIDAKSFRVFQVIAENAALVRGKDPGGYNIYTGPVYLIINHDQKYYYDDEIIKTPKGQVVRQIGIYQYPTKNDFVKTVPIIMIMDK